VAVVAPGTGDRAVAERDGSVAVLRCPAGRLGLTYAVKAAVGTGAEVVHLQHEVFLYGGAASTPGVLLALGALRAARRGPVVTMHQVVDPRSIDVEFVKLHRVPAPVPVARAALGTLQASIARLARATVVHEPGFAQVVPRSVVVRRPFSGPLEAGPRVSGSPAGSSASPPRRPSRATGKLVVLCFGFVAPYKGLEAVLEAAEAEAPLVEVVVAGSEHPRLAGQGYLPGLAGRYGGVARFVGHVPDDEVACWFEAADMAILAYPRAFSSSGVLALAARHGVPVLLSPSLAELYGADPALMVALDPPSLAARLRALATGREELEPLARATHALRNGRGWNDAAARHIALYEEVIDAQRGSRRNRRLPIR
jgi:glycosyltransferase involved in cell wall biosynthesis